jgi:CMP-N-acetylneuraminic acid synthetase
MRHAETLGRKYDAIAILEPTSPFITSAELSAAARELFADDKADAVVATRRVRPSTFYVQEESRYLDKVARNIAGKGQLRRQDEKEEITMSGGFYIARWEFFKKHMTFYSEKTLSFLVPDLHGLEIDEPVDWTWAEFLVEKGLAGLPAEKAGAR